MPATNKLQIERTKFVNSGIHLENHQMFEIIFIKTHKRCVKKILKRKKQHFLKIICSRTIHLKKSNRPDQNSKSLF